MPTLSNRMDMRKSEQAPIATVSSQVNSTLKYSTKVLYGIGQAAESIKMVTFGLFLLFFYTSVMGVPASVVGLVAAFGLVWDAIIDPYIGYLSDLTRSRLGRRHLYMFIGAITMGLCFWALFSPPRSLSMTGLIIWLLVTTLMVRSTTSIFSVPYLALGAELSQGYDERNSISGVRAAWALFGTLAAATLAFILFFPNVEPGVDPKLNYSGYPLMGLTFGLVMTLTALVATISTIGRRHFPNLQRQQYAPQSPTNFFAGVITAFSNSSFRALFISFALFFLGVVINATLSIYFLTYYVEVIDSRDIGILQAGFYIGGLVGVVVWLKFAKMVEKRWLYLIATLFTSLSMTSAVFLFGHGNPREIQAVSRSDPRYVCTMITG